MDIQNINESGFAAFQMAKTPPTLGKLNNNEKIREVAENFEAFFLGQMLQPMFSSIEPAKPFGGGHAEKIWKSLMVDEVGKSMAKNGGIGIANMIQRDLLKMQEVQ
jgi:Rod binding domain-containing protein